MEKVRRESRFLLIAHRRGTAPSTPTGKPTITGAILLPNRELIRGDVTSDLRSTVRDVRTFRANFPGTAAIKAAVATYTTTGSAEVRRESRFLLIAHRRGTAPSTPTGKPTITGAILLPNRELIRGDVTSDLRSTAVPCVVAEDCRFQKMRSKSHRPRRQNGIKVQITRRTGRPTKRASIPARTLPSTPHSGLSSNGWRSRRMGALLIQLLCAI
ncbi:hypothetical protein C0J52_21761 [Blattella germanica]|nr:hypothetical protein C0J52_21761 [Blattella germanica]